MLPVSRCLINNTYNEWTTSYGNSLSAYLAMMGLDLTKPLNEQPYYGSEDPAPSPQGHTFSYWAAMTASLGQ